MQRRRSSPGVSANPRRNVETGTPKLSGVGSSRISINAVVRLASQYSLNGVLGITRVIQTGKAFQLLGYFGEQVLSSIKMTMRFDAVAPMNRADRVSRGPCQRPGFAERVVSSLRFRFKNDVR